MPKLIQENPPIYDEVHITEYELHETWNLSNAAGLNAEKIVLEEGISNIEDALNNDAGRYDYVEDNYTDLFYNYVKEIVLPSSLKDICNAIAGYPNLEAIVAPGLVELGADAVYLCESLKSFPNLNQFESIASEAIHGCPRLSLSFGEMIIERNTLEEFENIGNMVPLLKAMEKGGIKRLTPYMAERLNTLYHASEEAFYDACTSYKQNGLMLYGKDTNMLFVWKDVAKTKELENAFIEKYKQVPRITQDLSLICTEYGYSVEDIVNNFDVNRTKTFLSKGIPSLTGGILMTSLDKKTFDKAIQNPYADEISYLCGQYNLTKENKYKNAALWLIEKPETNPELIGEILDALKYHDININPQYSVAKIRSELAKVTSLSEVEKIEREYMSTGFRFSECKCNLPNVTVTHDGKTARFLEAKDKRAVLIGYDTHCCQHLGGAGESAMMYGLVNPNAGFWVVEDDKDGTVLAQGEVWELPRNKITRKIPMSEESGRDISDLQQAILLFLQDEGGRELNYSTILTGTFNFLDKATTYTNPDTGKVVLIKRDGVRPEDRFEVKDWDGLYEAFGQAYPPILFNDFCIRNNLPVCMEPNGDVMRVEYKQYTSLVFDNIEFAKSANIAQFKEILAKWCQEAPYADILMGNGYNKMANDEFKVVYDVKPPFNMDIVRTLDKHGSVFYSDKSPEESYKSFLEHGSIYSLLYTDVRQGCSVLKEGGILAPTLKRAISNEQTPYVKRTLSRVKTRLEAQHPEKGCDRE